MADEKNETPEEPKPDSKSQDLEKKETLAEMDSFDEMEAEFLEKVPKGSSALVGMDSFDKMEAELLKEVPMTSSKLKGMDSFDIIEAELLKKVPMSSSTLKGMERFDKIEAEIMGKEATSPSTLKETDSHQRDQIVPMDSFERIEAEILRDEGAMSDFNEDYSIKDGTELDGDIEHPISLQKQANVDELVALDMQWEMEKQAIEEKALERLEVAELIKKAEEKLLPSLDTDDAMDYQQEDALSIAKECEEVAPELVQLDKIISAGDLIHMESSDLSEEEGFRLRLSCILEESESDSGSGLKIVSVKEPINKQNNNKELNNVKQNANEKSEEIFQRNNALEQFQTDKDKQTNDKNILLDPQCNEPDLENEKQNKNTEDVNRTEIPEEEVLNSLDSINSGSPEPTFGIRRLQSSTRVDEFRPTKRMESSSESSLDISIATTSPGAEETKIPFEIKIENVETENSAKDSEIYSSNSSLEIRTVNSQDISKSGTPDNVVVELDTSVDNQEPKNVGNCDIMELTDEDVQALFPKVRSRRGKSEEKKPEIEKCQKNVAASCENLGNQETKRQNIFSKFIMRRRGRSLESGIRPKVDKIGKKKKTKSETSSEKEEEEDRPPVPPETYLWEELRRWRNKGGYPWTHLDKPPFDEKTWRTQTDHEYEPINPPPLEQSGRRNEPAGIDKDRDEVNERRFLRIPRDDELVVSEEDMEVEAIDAARNFQDDLEDRFLATPMTATTASRTDCDVNTSMLDSSGLEDLPLKRDSRSKKALQSKTEQMRAQAQGIQQRIRSQAGKLRNKLRSIPRPSFQRKQEKARADGEERSRFRLPERAKFTLPERPRFKMPQKPKLSLPNFSNPIKDRLARSPGEKKNIFDLDFKTYPRMFNKKSKERGDYATSSPKLPRSATPPPAPLQPVRKKGPVGQRWVNRFDDIKFVDDRASEMSQPSERSDRSESLSGFHDREFALEDDLEVSRLPPARAISTKSSISHLSDREIQSSRSSEDRHKKGVIEEIDSDQFFLRQKGISEDDIDMGKYLSNEIREAFKAPVVNALRQLDLDYNELNNDKLQTRENIVEEPLAPTRMRSLKRTSKVGSKDEAVVEKENIPLEESKVERYGNIPVEEAKVERYENVAEKNRYDNLTDDNLSEYYKSPPPPEEYQHYKVPRSKSKSQPKRKSSESQQPSNKKKSAGWVEVEVETSLEEIPPGTPEPLQRRKSKKSLQGRQASLDAKLTYGGEPDYIIPAEVLPEAPKRTRSLSRGAPSLHSLAKEDDKHKPIAPKRTSSKSLHSLGLNPEPPKKEIDSRSVKSLALEENKVEVVAPKRIKSLSKGSRSFQSLSVDEELAQTPQPPIRMRSLSRASHGSRSFYSLADDERSWAAQAPDRTQSLNRPPKIGSIDQPSTSRKVNHYELPSEDGAAGYAVVEKPKPPRPPPPRRQKGSKSPNFNTFPRRSPIRPVRNYATLGPSRPPRKTKLKPAQSLEHIYSSDQISQSYAQICETLQANHDEDLHGSNKDLQATNVVEKMKGRPLPAPPRPPRLKAKSEEQSVEEVEEVCVYTQTDPLPDDMCLEDDIIQEFSHDQLRIQEQFLEEMREEEERIQREIEAKRARHIDVTVEREENQAKMEIIRQMDDIIKEERRLLQEERQAEADDLEEAKKKAVQQLEIADDDMGYASLDRRQTRLEDEPQPSTSYQDRNETLQISQTPAVPVPQPPIYIPLVPEMVQTERLRVGELEVDRLTVNQLEARNLTIQDLFTNAVRTQDLSGTSMQVQSITGQSGNLSLGNIDLPPEFIQQIIARIPWEEIRPTQPVHTDVESMQAVVRSPTVEEPAPVVQTTTRRRHKTKQRSRSHISSDEESGSRLVSSTSSSRQRQHRHMLAEIRPEPSISDLGQQLARACTNAGVKVMQEFAAHVRPPPQVEERTRYIQVVLFVILVAIAGYILLAVNGNDVHHHHWDFQFPPQPSKE